MIICWTPNSSQWAGNAMSKDGDATSDSAFDVNTGTQILFPGVQKFNLCIYGHIVCILGGNPDAIMEKFQALYDNSKCRADTL